jgi:threonine synthase
VKYISTRGAAPVLGFGDVLLTGLAADGGLYVPETWPTLSPAVWADVRPYADVAVEVMWPYVEGAIDRENRRPRARTIARGTWRYPATAAQLGGSRR